MSWNHGDYLNLASAVGTIFAGIYAAIAANHAKKATIISRKALLEEQKRSDLTLLYEELVELSKRCNASVGDDSYVIFDEGKIVEMATALASAKESIDSFELDDASRYRALNMFVRKLRPGILGEITHATALLNTKGLSIDTLRDQYRCAQIFLEIENPTHIPEPNIQCSKTKSS